MKTKIALLTVITLLTLACSALVPSAPTRTPQPTVSPWISSGLTLQSSPWKEAGDKPPYQIEAQIPQLVGADDSRVQIFNDYLTEIVKNEVEIFKTDTLSYASAPPIANGSSLDIQYQLIGQRGDVWSLQFLVMLYMDGAAHPSHYSISVNYDLANSREIQLSELFVPNADYLKTISDFCAAELSARDIGFEDFSVGAAPDLGNYTRWNLADDGSLIITFDEYQVASYAAGPQTVKIPISQLKEIINPSGALALFEVR
ncbi:MAG: RsiV family protein [Anaerolineales bacterium]|nr:RsiV family protein [Anaerolineales bacterium]